MSFEGLEFNHFIVNGIVGAIVVGTAIYLLVKLILRSKKENNFLNYARLYFILANMTAVWTCQILLFFLQYYNFFFLYFSPLVQLVSTFCFAHWYFNSARNTVGLELNPFFLKLLDISLYAVPALLYFSYAINEAWPYSIPIFKFG